MKIIVSRYLEDVNWTRQFNNVLIYNKGSPIEPHYNQINLPNVGREGHTYYTHIYNNYDNLDDYTIFLQGYPFDHSPNIINQLNYYIHNNINIDFEHLSQNVFTTSLKGCPFKAGLPFREVFQILFNENIDDMPNDYGKELVFGAGAQFIVSKHKILSRPKEFYLKIIQLLSCSSDPIEGHVIERFHPIIFNNLEENLPPNFNLEIYKYCNPSLSNLSNYQLLHHFKYCGRNENRIYIYPDNFNFQLYKENNPDLQHLNNMELIKHWYNNGINEGRINPFLKVDIDISIYRLCNPDLKHLSDIDLIDHWNNYGSKENRIYTIPGNFNYQLYREYHPDLKDLSDIDLLKHWFSYGLNEVRINPFLNKKIDLSIYRLCNPDLINLSHIDLVNHWNNYGNNENRIYKAPENFNYQLYRENNEDLKELSDIELLCHWYNYGIMEGRISPLI